MIRTESFAVSRETFAAEQQVLTDAAADLHPHVADALGRIGLPSWEMPVVAAALEIFDTTARAQVDAWGPVLDDLQEAFAVELGRALAGTSWASAQAVELSRRISQAAYNAGIEAAATSDPDTEVGLEWIGTCTAHSSLSGQRVRTGHEFAADGVRTLYPGQALAAADRNDCSCVVRPVMLDSEPSGNTGQSNSLTAAADPEDGDVSTTCVIVALPAASDPVTAASSEPDGAHCTLLFLGDTAALDRDALAAAIQEWVQEEQLGVVTDAVNGRATLGKDQADVVLLDAASLVEIRGDLLQIPVIAEACAAVEQFPTWLPHVTLGYPAAPRLSDDLPAAITFDRIALWFGEDRTAVFPLGETMPAKEPADAVTAAVENALPLPAEAPAAPATPGLRPWHGVLAPEGVPSGDGRQFAAGSLTNRDLPLPLKAMFTDDEGHKGSVVVARIDSIFREDGVIKGEGVFDDTPEADRAYEMLAKKMWRGVSVDVDSADIAMSADGTPENAQVMEFSTARIASATMCAIPAFAEAYVAIGTWAENPGESAPTGAEDEIPSEPSVSIVASAGAGSLSADYFRNPLLEQPTALTLANDGHIFGHLAAWNACHIGYEVCTTAPPSTTDYAYFLTGQVFTDAGPVAVGQVTLGGGHANGKLGVRGAMAHYDNTGTAIADITVGEDAHGVWFSGKLRDGVTEKQVHEFFAAGLSGDWRGVRFRGQESMELVAALAVNVQGFPVPRTRFAMDGTRQLSLVAAGIPVRATPAVLDPAFRTQMDAYLAQQKRTETAAQLSAEIRAFRLAEIATQFTTLKGQ
ncbi:MAG TPA: hypothetical protein DEP82_14540 [Arthrobacter bacterium]|nr:hypothetical protein [Arthrobacter sp.]